jgi:hypothetical protein
VPMSAFEEKVRGARARQILDDEVFKDAIAKAQDSMLDDLINVIVDSPDAPLQALRGVMRIQALYAVVESIRSIATTGEIAADEEDA